jgi:hypothetical protein
VLTVTDGTNTAHITLMGNYTASTFTVSSDGAGGTKVVDPTKATLTTPPKQPLAAAPLVIAMASFGAGSGAPIHTALASHAAAYHGALAVAPMHRAAAA